MIPFDVFDTSQADWPMVALLAVFLMGTVSLGVLIGWFIWA